MTDPVTRLERADAAADLARARLDASVASLQRRLAPERLVEDAKRELTDVSRAATRHTVAVARAKPGVLAGLVAVAGLFLARRRLFGILRRPVRQPATTTRVERVDAAPERI